MAIKGKILVEILRAVYSAPNNNQLADKLGANYLTIRNWSESSLTKTKLKNAIKAVHSKHANRVDGEDFISYGKKKYGVKTDLLIAEVLGSTQPALVNWRQNGLTLRSLFEVIEKSRQANLRSSIEPIVEFYPILRTETKQKKKFEILGKSPASLKEVLNDRNGIYLFYDSRGHAIYSGKAKAQVLWKEMNNAYNRKRGDSQLIRKVSHLKKNKYKKGKQRQITNETVHLHEIAVYFSAYSVSSHLIDNLEAAIIRMFPNDLMNKKIEKIKVD